VSQSALRCKIARAVRAKLKRIRDGQKPKVLDLFAGCGGISLGFERAGFVIVGGVERDPDAAASFYHNFFGKRLRPPPVWLTEGALDITRTNPADLVAKSVKGAGLAVDLLVGGPPCQAFARIGRAKLRSVTEDPEAWLSDPRADLYKSYLRFVAELAPCALMMENVPDFMAHGGENMAEEACANLEALGYRAWYTLMNASFWGVPQHRERMILVALHESVGSDWTFPGPTHRASPPTGYKGTRAAALALVTRGESDFLNKGDENTHFRQPPDEVASGQVKLKREVTVSQAIVDIPRIPIGQIVAGFSRKPREWPYGKVRLSDYASVMRNWRGHEASDCIVDHMTRYLPRDFKIFADMEQGEQYPEMHMRQTKLRNAAAKRMGLREKSVKWLELTAHLVPPYPADKFPNKWYRLRSRQPSRTLLAHLGKDGYTHIHPVEARVISVREAARLQSFPDGFQFCGSMNAMFRQIGNSVPPLLALTVARQLMQCLKRTQ